MPNVDTIIGLDYCSESHEELL